MQTVLTIGTEPSDIDHWLATLSQKPRGLEVAPIRQLLESLPAEDLEFSLQLAAIVADLKMDQSSVLAALAYRSVRTRRWQLQDMAAVIGEEGQKLVTSVLAMATTSLLEISNSNLQDKEQESQVENVKRMLVSLIDDPRVAVLKLAERLVALRRSKHQEAQRRERIALEAMHIFAPLAGRLGIAQVKWELEDLAFRFTQESTYMQVARQLASKRRDRERWAGELEDKVRALLRSAGIEGHVAGRAKHIFSIWRKMQVKGVDFAEVYDAMAVRVVVERLSDCYAALGVLHTTWPHIPSEFDDYIANPKENGYRSIHTAVTLDDGKILEIQIRTSEMHEEAELGVCAHWDYKGDEAPSAAYVKKMEWLRQVMEWHEELGGTERLSTLLVHRVSDNRIYVSTPKGHVLDLPRGATLLDFAYRVHTDVGHGCRGGLVNGRAASLDYKLKNSETVEVITEPDGEPRREWLERELRFVYTDRARAKLTGYFRACEAAVQRETGRRLIEADVAFLGLKIPDGLSQRWQCSNLDELYERVGAGELSGFDVVAGIIEQSESQLQQHLPGLRQAPDAGTRIPVCISIEGENRDGLLRDITEIVTSQKLTLTETTGRVSPHTDHAIIRIETRLSDWIDGLRLASHLRLLPGVSTVTSKRIG